MNEPDVGLVDLHFKDQIQSVHMSTTDCGQSKVSQCVQDYIARTRHNGIQALPQSVTVLFSSSHAHLFDLQENSFKGVTEWNSCTVSDRQQAQFLGSVEIH